MKQKIFGLRSWILMALSILLQCNGPIQTDPKIFRQLAVSWQLNSNFIGLKDGFEATFQLRNLSSRDFESSDWALFFNIAPRPIIDTPEPQPGKVIHLNGDWYKLVPEPGFSISAGDSIEIKYRGTEGVIKETDAPLGLYFVTYQKDRTEKEIIPVADYQIIPFVNPDQINRNAADEDPIPTPEYLYEQNLSMSGVPDNDLPLIIPTPIHCKKNSGSFTWEGKGKIFYHHSLINEATLLAEALNELTGTKNETSLLENASGNSGPSIRLKLEPTTAKITNPEAYRLKISAQGLEISATDPAGIFYGIQSLKSLVPLQNFESPGSIIFPQVEVEDAPRFEYRGLHVDVSRNFQNKETILRLIDLMAFYKLNRLLLYTTEDEGWRLEIPGLPELTAVGAQREHTSDYHNPVLHPAYGSGPVAYGEGSNGSGYYTRSDFIEMLKFATARHVKVIPVLNFPAHARAAIKSMEARYARLMAEGKEAEANEYRLIDPEDSSTYLSAQAYKDNTVSVARESTYRFYEKVVDEISLMYQDAGLKLDEFHAGGDEVPEGAWRQSPEAQALMAQLPDVKDPKNLQNYFFGKLLDHLEDRQLQIDGWEEVALLKAEDGSYIPNPRFADRNVVPFIWNNLFDYPDLGYRLANAGYQVVLCNVSNFYFDLAYNKDPREPGLYWAGFVNTRDSWAFAPFDFYKTTFHTSMGREIDWEQEFPQRTRLNPEARKNILGLQAQLWSETIKGREMLEYYTLPKLVGFAESAWAQERSWELIEDAQRRKMIMDSEWNIFANKLSFSELPRLNYLNGGYRYRIPPPGAHLENGLVAANLEFPGLVIRYTEDGSEPGPESSEYSKPFPSSGIIKFKAFDKAGNASRTVVFDVSENSEIKLRSM